MLYGLCAIKWSNYYIVDIVAAVVILIFTIIAARKGFINCMLGFIVTVIAIVVALVFADNLLEVSGGIFGLQGSMEKGITDLLAKNKMFSVDISDKGLTDSLKSANIPGFIVDAIVKEIGHSEIPAGTTVAMLVGPKVASLVCLLICGLLLFLVVKLLGRLIGKFLDKKVKSIPLIGGLNALFGALVGFIEGLLIICGILAILSLFVSSGISTFFDQTLFVGKWFHDNPLGKILSLIGF